MFQAVTQDGKEEGHVEIISKPSINDGDIEKLHQYFVNNMKSAP